MGRAPCCDKTKVKKGPWSPEEDATLKNYLHKYGTGGNWIALPGKAGLKRCGKSCRLRWLNYLRPNIKHGGFTEEEDSIICDLYNKLGSRWSVIASQLQGRTDNDVKNHWNTKLKKKLVLSTKSNPNNNPNLHSSTPSTPLKPKIEAHSPSFSAVLTQNCGHGLNVSIVHSEFNAASAKKSTCTSLSSSTILNSSSFVRDDNYSWWCAGNGGEDQNDGFSMDFGTGFSYDLINIANWHQEMVSELVGSSHAIS